MPHTTNTQRRKQMIPYVVERLENSGIYVAKDVSPNCLEIKTQENSPVYIFLHTNPNGSDEFIHGENGLHKLLYAKNFVANIFYKDGLNFFRLLDRKGRFVNTSMSNYDYNEISRMVGLRDKEREVLRLLKNKRLVYYQPDNREEGGRLTEGIVSFEFNPTQASYNHINPSRRGYDFIMADNGKILDTRKISGNKKYLTGKIAIDRDCPNRHMLTFQEEKGSPSHPDQNDLVKAFLKETGKTIDDFGGDVSEYINPQ